VLGRDEREALREAVSDARRRRLSERTDLSEYAPLYDEDRAEDGARRRGKQRERERRGARRRYAEKQQERPQLSLPVGEPEPECGCCDRGRAG
jgi:hypothetical protein